MKAFRLYWEQTGGLERGTFLLLLLPLLLTLHPGFRLALPFWWMGFFQAMVSYRLVHRQSGRALKLYLGSLAFLSLANGLLQANWTSPTWTQPLTHALWFALGMPAGQHFFVYAREGGPEALFQSPDGPREGRRVL